MVLAVQVLTGIFCALGAAAVSRPKAFKNLNNLDNLRYLAGLVVTGAITFPVGMYVIKIL